jgi:predicted dinucleotide-utilizing enzyme
MHHVEVAAGSGTMTVELLNYPSSADARSSGPAALSALSALAAIRRTAASLWVDSVRQGVKWVIRESR